MPIEDDITYWHQQLKAYLQTHEEGRYHPTSDYNTREVFVLTDEMDTEERASFVLRLQRAGFQVTSSVRDEEVRINADKERLNKDYT